MSTRIAAALLIVSAAWLSAAPVSLANGEHEIVEVRLVSTGDSAAPFAFEPDVLEITQGITVRWINDENVFHTVTSGRPEDNVRGDGTFHQSVSSEGDTFEYTFDEAGEFPYFCQPHSSFMTGMVTVAADPSHEPGDGSTDDGTTEDEAASPVPGLLAVLAGILLLAVALRRRR